MNKKEFLRKLNEKLSILDPSEIKDIINEYEDIIDEKVKNGALESEAIKDFGDIDELATEILKAYKINPKFNQDKSKISFDDFEDFVKKCATKLSDFAREVAESFKSDNISIEFIFEILIKSLILLAIFAVLRLPFKGIDTIGEAILNINIFPIDVVLSAVWSIIVWILYFATCVMVGIAMFKNSSKNKNVKKEIKNTKKKINKSNSKKEAKEEKSTKNEEKKDKVIKEKVEKEFVPNNGISFSQVIMFVVKLFTFIFILLPILFSIIGLIFAMVFSIYYFIIGVNCLGIILILMGVLSIAILIYEAIKAIFTHKHFNYFLSFLIGLVLIATGIILTFNWVTKLTANSEDYYDNTKYVTEQFNYNVVSGTKVVLGRNYQIVPNENLADGQIMIEAKYYKDTIKMNSTNEDNQINLYGYANTKDNIETYHVIIDNLKDDKFYNYSNLYDINFVVYGNSNTLNMITVK